MEIVLPLELTEKIRSLSSDNLSDEALRCCIYVELSPDINDLRIGGSKFGGLPDCSSDFVWPLVGGEPLVFLAQLNLSEFYNILPDFAERNEWLYFFYGHKHHGFKIIHVVGSRDSLSLASSLPHGLTNDEMIMCQKPIFKIGCHLDPNTHLSEIEENKLNNVFRSFTDSVEWYSDDYFPSTRVFSDIEFGGEFTNRSGDLSDESKILLLEVNMSYLKKMSGRDFGDFSLYFALDKMAFEKRDFSKVIYAVDHS